MPDNAKPPAGPQYRLINQCLTKELKRNYISVQLKLNTAISRRFQICFYLSAENTYM